MNAAPDEKPWLALVGIGEDGAAGLSPAARAALLQASLVVGGRRHLALAGEFPGARMEWPSPIEAGLPEILARRGEKVCALASGDPFFYGVGTLIAAHLPPREFACFPAPSSFSLAAARLGWSLQDCALVSLHGRPFARLIPALQPGAKILALSWDAGTPEKIARFLEGRGLGAARLIALEALGGPRERIRETRAEGFNLADVDPLNLVAIELPTAPREKFLPLAPGLDDALFETDGQITKSLMRAATIAALAPRRGELLWDVGAGSGSIAVEWARLDPASRAIAIEARADRAERIARNAQALGAPQVEIVRARAPAAFAGLPRPDAVFVGGGLAEPGVLDGALAALAPGGRLVANAVTLEGEAELLARRAAHGGALTRVAFAEAAPLGGFETWRPSIPATQWRFVKPEAPA